MPSDYRKCCKCGKTRAMDRTVTYHRFPFPGTSNIVKARAWATYCWPDKDWSYDELCSLNNKCSLLCGRHFSDTQFYDNNRQKLSKFAVPDSPEVEELLNKRENIFDPNKEPPINDTPGGKVLLSSSNPIEEHIIVVDTSASEMNLTEDPSSPTHIEEENMCSTSETITQESRRKCIKCDRSPLVDGVKLFCFPEPSVKNLHRCYLWARFIYPDRDISLELLTKLYNEGRMLCQLHFRDAEFTDESKQNLIRSAVPCDNKEQENATEKGCMSSSKPIEGREIVIQPSTSDMSLLKDHLAPTYKEQIKLEVCIDSLESAVNAIQGGADELELCSALNDGGLTPSVGLVKEVLKLVEAQSSQTRTKVNVMLRCRGGDDFQYNSYEMVTMLSDLQIFKDMGVDRFVFGALTDTLTVDEENCMKVLLKAQPVSVTFHRAFDLCIDPIQSIDTIINLGFDRLLTSGQQSTARDTEAVKLIEGLVQQYGEEIEVMPGSGVNCSNARTFVDLGCSIVHSSCKKNRILPKLMERDFTMGGTNEIYVTDESIVKKMKEILQG